MITTVGIELTDIERLRTQVEEAARRALATAELLRTQNQETHRIISDHGQMVRDLVLQTMQRKGFGYCTKCNNGSLWPRGTMEFYLLEGCREYRHGYERGLYSFEKFSEPHLLCDTCRTRVVNRHGYVGPYDRQAHDQEVFYAYRMREEGEKLFANKNGTDVEIANKLPEIPDWIIRDIAKKWELPPFIKIGSDGKIQTG